MPPSLDLFTLATRIINHTGRHLFLTGKAGTGKTTFLKHIQETTPKKAVVVAPTGVAALNAGGVTMHSFFHLPLGMYLPDSGHYPGDEWNNQLVVNRHSLFQNIRYNQERRELLQEMELLIIDEVSMLRADTLDAIDTILRRFRSKPLLPFGGVQVLFIGDLFQLPPVLRQEEASLYYEHYQSPFFFSAQVIQGDPPLIVELKHIYRQSDARFIDLLNAIRDNHMQEEDLALLHERYKPGQKLEAGSILLTTHNAQADRINAQKLEELAGELFCFEAEIEREFNELALPAERFLKLKVGAQIMFIKNDTAHRYFNGKLATIFHIGEEKDIWVRLEGSLEELKLELHTWKNIRYKYDRERDQVDEEEIGAFKQYPIRLAWAITIHKSQGLTFERATVDVGSSFASGQIYVALSRLRSLDGLLLHSRIPSQGIEMPEIILDFCRQQVAPELLEKIVRQEEEHFAQHRLVEWLSLEKFLNEWILFHQGYEKRRIEAMELAREWSHNCLNQLQDIEATAQKFRVHLDRLLGPGCDYAHISERVEAATAWFSNKLPQQVLLPLQVHFEAWKKKARSKKYLLELKTLEVSALQQIKRYRQAQQLVSGLAGGIARHEIKIGNEPVVGGLSQATQKPKKGDSFKATLALYQAGRSIAEIASERGLAQSTIEGHLIHFIPSGEVSLSVFVNPKQQQQIEAAIARLPEHASSTEIKDLLGEQISYTMIRAVQRSQVVQGNGSE
ncbi:MAG: helix-turn-helix domain-containing protein [Bacteroidetes bacterium]|nr:helix-turn-helix domain-containing protein [Bacteroidota bacterium]MBS1630739.1 helix-turn-helix domain-containing protein [Bacteroidota bacterium]